MALETIKVMCVEVKQKLENCTLARFSRNPMMEMASICMVGEESLPDRLVCPKFDYTNNIVTSSY